MIPSWYKLGSSLIFSPGTFVVFIPLNVFSIFCFLLSGLTTTFEPGVGGVSTTTDPVGVTFTLPPLFSPSHITLIRIVEGISASMVKEKVLPSMLLGDNSWELALADLIKQPSFGVTVKHTFSPISYTCFRPSTLHFSVVTRTFLVGFSLVRLSLASAWTLLTPGNLFNSSMNLSFKPVPFHASPSLLTRTSQLSPKNSTLPTNLWYL